MGYRFLCMILTQVIIIFSHTIHFYAVNCTEYFKYSSNESVIPFKIKLLRSMKLLSIIIYIFCDVLMSYYYIKVIFILKEQFLIRFDNFSLFVISELNFLNVI